MGRWRANQSQFSIRQAGKHPLLSNLMMSQVSQEQFLPQPRTWGLQGQSHQYLNNGLVQGAPVPFYLKVLPWRLHVSSVHLQLLPAAFFILMRVSKGQKEDNHSGH